MEAKSIATLPSNSLPPGYRGIETLSAADIGSVIAVSFLVVSAISVAIYAVLPKRVQPHSFSLNLPPKAPCQHCRYFSQNPYLKCTLHPSTVLTKQAVDCLDYCPSNKLKQATEE